MPNQPLQLTPTSVGVAQLFRSHNSKYVVTIDSLLIRNLGLYATLKGMTL
jgi:hypothetical protein